MNKKIKLNISVFTLLCIVLFIVVIILFVIFRTELSVNKDSSEIISNIFTIAAFLGVILALIDYKNRAYESKKQALLALKYQLVVIGTWSNYEGTGYHKSDQIETIKNNITNWGNPFSEVFKTNFTALQALWLIPGYIKLSETILEKIAEFLTSLDNKVDLINKELEQAKLFKKSLLQQMFV